MTMVTLITLTLAWNVMVQEAAVPPQCRQVSLVMGMKALKGSNALAALDSVRWLFKDSLAVTRRSQHRYGSGDREHEAPTVM